MKTGIHPNYKKATVKCACGNEFETGSVKKRYASRFALSAILSIQAVKNSLLLMDVLTALTKNTVLSNNRYNKQAGIRSCLFFYVD